ncbi:augmin subunit 6 [Tanacetum coccineum]
MTIPSRVSDLDLQKARIALERRRFLKNAETAVQRQDMWSNLAHEMTEEYRGLCADEMEGEQWDELVSSSSHNSHLVQRATRFVDLWSALPSTLEESSSDEVTDVTSRLSSVNIDKVSSSPAHFNCHLLNLTTQIQLQQKWNLYTKHAQVDNNQMDNLMSGSFVNYHFYFLRHENDYTRNLKKSVREAALSTRSSNTAQSQDSHSDDGSGTGFSRVGPEKKAASLRSKQLFVPESQTCLVENRVSGGFKYSESLDTCKYGGRLSFYDVEGSHEQVFSPPFLMDASLSADSFEDLLVVSLWLLYFAWIMVRGVFWSLRCGSRVSVCFVHEKGLHGGVLGTSWKIRLEALHGSFENFGVEYSSMRIEFEDWFGVQIGVRYGNIDPPHPLFTNIAKILDRRIHGILEQRLMKSFMFLTKSGWDLVGNTLVVQSIISELESQGALPRSNSRVSSLATCCGPRFVELLWQLSLHALREVHRRTYAADVVSNPLPASLTDVAFSHAATLLPVTKLKITRDVLMEARAQVIFVALNTNW